MSSYGKWSWFLGPQVGPGVELGITHDLPGEAEAEPRTTHVERSVAATGPLDSDGRWSAIHECECGAQWMEDVRRKAQKCPLCGMSHERENTEQAYRLCSRRDWT